MSKFGSFALTTVLALGMSTSNATLAHSGNDVTTHHPVVPHGHTLPFPYGRRRFLENHNSGGSSGGGIGSWQPAVCRGTPAEQASFQNVGGTMPLFINMLNTTGSAGAQINLPAGISPNTFSFDVIPTATSSNVTVYVSGTDSLTPSGSFFGTNGPANSTNGNTVTFDLQNLLGVGHKNADPGSTITSLYIDCFTNSASVLGDVYVDNPVINGIPIKTKIMTLIDCPPRPF